MTNISNNLAELVENLRTNIDVLGAVLGKKAGAVSAGRAANTRPPSRDQRRLPYKP